VTSFWLALAEVGAVLAGATAAGYALAPGVVPPSECRAERIAWGFALGLGLLGASVPLGFLVHVSPRWMAIGLALIAVGVFFFRRGSSNPKPRIQSPKSKIPLLALIVLGVSLYLLRALTEPMWSNDYLAIWGFKGKTIFGAGGVPRRLFTDSSLGYSHPEYPLGLPFVYSAVAFVLRRWDDHAMALLFPALQIATLLALGGWLRRRGASPTLALAAAATLSLFEPLYSAFLTGMADVPYSFAVLLFGCALADALERADPLADRRLSLATLLAVSTKKEGLLLAAAGVLLWLFARRKGASRGVFAAIVIPAVLLSVGGRLWKGELPLRDFDLAYLGPTLILEFLPRLAESIHAGFREVFLPAWPGLLCLAALVAAGRPDPSGDRLLGLVGLCAFAYLIVPSLAVLGPDWLVRTSLARTLSALVPLTAAAVAVRLKSVPSVNPAKA
jgi:hypothetical protein